MSEFKGKNRQGTSGKLYEDLRILFKLIDNDMAQKERNVTRRKIQICAKSTKSSNMKLKCKITKLTN